MERAFKRFIDISKIPPKRVIFFRDGVSEGEYNTMATTELEAIQGTFELIIRSSDIWDLFFFLAAIKTIVGGRDYKILVTFIIVGKRYVLFLSYHWSVDIDAVLFISHHSVFFPIITSYQESYLRCVLIIF